MPSILTRIMLIALAAFSLIVNCDNIDLHLSPKEKNNHSPPEKENKFIVTLHPDYTHDHFEAFFVNAHVKSHALSTPMVVHHKYSHVLHGLAVSNIDEDTLRTYPGVLRVKKESLYYKSQTRYGSKIGWGQDRIDQASRPLDSKYTPDYTGVGVDVYIIDTRKQSSHTLHTLQ
jgi:hypothetical protein